MGRFISALGALLTGWNGDWSPSANRPAFRISVAAIERLFDSRAPPFEHVFGDVGHVHLIVKRARLVNHGMGPCYN